MKKLFIFLFLVLCTSVMGQQREHIVAKGETLASIAKKYGLTESDLKAANPNMSVCFTGVKLTIPTEKKVTEKNLSTTRQAKQEPIEVKETPAKAETITPKNSVTSLIKTSMRDFHGRTWYLLEENGYYGAEDSLGNVIIPLSEEYDSVFNAPLADGVIGWNMMMFGVRKIINGEAKYGLRNKNINTGLRYSLISSGLFGLLPDYNNRKEYVKRYNREFKKNPTAAQIFCKGWAYTVGLGHKKAAESCFKKALNMKDCSLEIAFGCLQGFTTIEFRREAGKEFRSDLMNDVFIPILETAQTAIANSMDTQDNTSDSDVISSSSNSNKSTTRTKSKQTSHANWQSLENSYSNYESQLVKMKSDGRYDKQEVRNIQRKMKDIRAKIKEQSGHDRAVSPLENWNP